MSFKRGDRVSYYSIRTPTRAFTATVRSVHASDSPHVYGELLVLEHKHAPLRTTIPATRVTKIVFYPGARA